MKFLTLYKVQSYMWDTNKPDVQPRNHLGNGDFTALCGQKGVEWMGGYVEYNEIGLANGVCKRCLKHAEKLINSYTHVT